MICKRSDFLLCYMTTLKNSFLMVHSNHVEVARAKRKSKDAKRERSFDGGFKSRSLGLRSRFQVNFLPSSQSLLVIGCLTLSSRR